MSSSVGAGRAMAGASTDLESLARSLGVEPSYVDGFGVRRSASPDAIRAILADLDPGDTGGPRASGIEPVVVAWGDEPPVFEIVTEAGSPRGTLRAEVALEGGETRRYDLASQTADGVGTRVRLTLPEPLPHGYHDLRVEGPGGAWTSRILAAPRTARTLAPGERAWGVFLPLYALRTGADRGFGAGDLGDLRRLGAWTASLGGGVVATLPMLAAFLDEPYDASPYAPVSRRFWNELYLDLERVPELARSPEARALLASSELAGAIADLRRGETVDYRGTSALRRRVIEAMLDHLLDHEPDRRRELEHALDEDPELRGYARFRAVTERRRAGWPAWPERLRQGPLEAEDADPRAELVHAYVQWLLGEQLGTLAAEARASGPGLYLDLPLGVHGAGYDTWRERGLFAGRTSVGAPPDALFARGQCWGFPPLRPGALREQGHAHFVDVIRRHLRYAGVLRIDHVMGLHRQFWVPEGFDATDGAYVRYPAEELYAILCIESQRAGSLIVGEDLGTVPDEVRPAMERRGIHRLHVLTLEAGPEPDRAIADPPPTSLASLGTHDLPPFAAYWTGADVDDRLARGEIDATAADEARVRRETVRRALLGFLRARGRLAADREDPWAVLCACVEHLAAGPASVLVLNLEDLWLETEPQNRPGHGEEAGSWRRRSRITLAELERNREVVAHLECVDALRKEGARR